MEDVFSAPSENRWNLTKQASQKAVHEKLEKREVHSFFHFDVFSLSIKHRNFCQMAKKLLLIFNCPKDNLKYNSLFFLIADHHELRLHRLI